MVPTIKSPLTTLATLKPNWPLMMSFWPNTSMSWGLVGSVTLMSSMPPVPLS